MFLLKMGWASLFGALLLVAMIITDQIWRDDWPIARYDALLAYALALQALFLALRMESWREARVILLFHITGTVMEIFKVNAGSWAYPGDGLIKFAGVPLFSGFMYASVGSFMARAIRLFDMRFTPYPPFWSTMLLAIAIYVNFLPTTICRISGLRSLPRHFCCSYARVSGSTSETHGIGCH